MNILILSAGTRNKIVQYFKKEVGSEGNVIATDCSNLAPAIYEADRFYLVPRITDPNYLEVILGICEKEDITAVFSLIDPELSLLAKERKRFEAVGTTPIVSDYQLVETCFNKFKTYRLFQEMGINTAKCYENKGAFLDAVLRGEVDYPVFVKPVTGSASMNINKVVSEQELDLLLSRYPDLMIQEFMEGIEYGADVYIDMITGECSAIFIKEKVKMRAGETDKSIAIKDQYLFDVIQNFVEKCGFCGMIDMDIFKIKEQYYISEINPRFGGGYPHAYESGVNIPRQIIKNLQGQANPVAIGDYKSGICMMKYNEIAVIHLQDAEIVR